MQTKNAVDRLDQSLSGQVRSSLWFVQLNPLYQQGQEGQELRNVIYMIRILATSTATENYIINMIRILLLQPQLLPQYCRNTFNLDNSISMVSTLQSGNHIILNSNQHSEVTHAQEQNIHTQQGTEVTEQDVLSITKPSTNRHQKTYFGMHAILGKVALCLGAVFSFLFFFGGGVGGRLGQRANLRTSFLMPSNSTQKVSAR